MKKNHLLILKNKIGIDQHKRQVFLTVVYDFFLEKNKIKGAGISKTK